MSNLLAKIKEKKLLSNLIVKSFAESGCIDELPDSFVSRSGLTKNDLLEKLDNMKACCDTIEHKVYKNGDEKILTGSHCQNPSVCPLCSARLQSTRRARLLPKVTRACHRYPHCYKITFTITDSPYLYDMIRDLKRFLRAFRKMGQKRKEGYSAGEWSKVRAGVMSIEVKRGEGSKLWHVHAHAIIWCDDLIDYSMYNQKKKKELEEFYGRGNIPKDKMDEIKETKYIVEKINSKGEKESVYMSKLQYEWYLATGSNGCNIDCERLKKVPSKLPVESQKRYFGLSYAQSITDQCKEIIKYDFKYNDFESSDDFFTILTETKGSRFLSTFGDFRGYDYERIIKNLKLWARWKYEDSSQFALWILRNTDLRNVIGKRAPMEKLFELMYNSGMDDIEVAAVKMYFKLDRELLDEYTEPDIRDGEKSALIFDYHLQVYRKTSGNNIDHPGGGLSRKAREEINKITGAYRAKRREIIESNVKNLSIVLNELKSDMRGEVARIVEMFKPQSQRVPSYLGQLTSAIKEKSKLYWQSVFDTTAHFNPA